jgi:enoyl-CoA hydratase/carnithine racemase
MIPWGKATEILLMGKPVDAQEAYRIGMVNKVVPLDQLLPTAREWAENICQVAPQAVIATKKAIVKGYDMILGDGSRQE